MFCNPSESSYERLRSFKSMRYVAWTHKAANRWFASRRKRMGQYGLSWSPDFTANQRISFIPCSLCRAGWCKTRPTAGSAFDNGLQGMDENELKSLEQLPEHFDEAMQLAQESPVYPRPFSGKATGGIREAECRFRSITGGGEKTMFSENTPQYVLIVSSTEKEQNQFRRLI